MKTALFIILPYPSHYNASFGLAKEFKNNGFQVIYTGYNAFKDYIEIQGFKLREISYTTIINIHQFKNFLSSLLLSLMDRKYLMERYRIWYKSVIDVNRICKDLNPDYIFIDAHLSHYYL